MSRARLREAPQESYKIQHRQQLLLKMKLYHESRGNLCRRGRWKRSRSYLRHQQCGRGTRASSTPIVLFAPYLGVPAIPGPDQVINRIRLCSLQPILSAHDQAPVQVIKVKRYPLTSARPPTPSNLQSQLSPMRPH